MYPENFEIEVEYRLGERNKRQTGIPTEFRDLVSLEDEKPRSKPSPVLLFLAETLIKTGNAIKRSQFKTAGQRVYS